MLRLIREEEPPRPSTRLSELGRRLSIDRRGQAVRADPALRTLLRGELDWIVMKCLEKDRNAALRDGQRAGPGRRALPGGRAGRGVSAVGRLPAPQVRPQIS